MRKVFTTDAVVLNKKPLLNNNLLLTLLTKKMGKINVFAFGIRKITSRRLSYFQVGNLLKTVIEKKDDRFFLKEVSLISAFSLIKEDKKKWPYFFQYFYILNKILPENIKEEKNFFLTLDFLINLSKKENDFDRLNYYLNKLLKNLGYIEKEQKIAANLKTIEEIIEEKLPNFSL